MNEEIRLTFLLTNVGPVVKGPYTLGELRQMWAENKINEETKLFLTWRNYETKDMICRNIRASQIKQSLESEMEIDVEAFRSG